MAFVTIADFSGSAELVVFPRTYKECATLLQIDKCLAVKAKISTRNDEKGFILDGAKGL